MDDRKKTDIRAKDIMVPIDQYPHVPHFFTIKQTVAVIERSTIEKEAGTSLPRSVLIFDEKYRLIGIVRRRDILRGLEPDFLRSLPLDNRREMFNSEADSNLAEMQFENIEQEVKDRGELPIHEITRPLDARVDHNDHLARIVHEMVHYHQNLLPVIKDGRVVGVLRSVDVFHQVAKFVI